MRNSAKLRRTKEERYDAELEKMRQAKRDITLSLRKKQAQRDSYCTEPEKMRQDKRDRHRFKRMTVQVEVHSQV